MKVFLSQVVVFHQSIEEVLKGILLVRELGFDFGLEQLDVVIEIQVQAWERDTRAFLLGQLKVVPSKSQLLEQASERPFFGPFLCEIGHRMQSDIVIPTIYSVERV